MFFKFYLGEKWLAGAGTDKLKSFTPNMSLWSGSSLNNYFKITFEKWINPPSNKPLFGLKQLIYPTSTSSESDYTRGCLVQESTT